MFHYIIGGAFVAAILVVIANFRVKSNSHNSTEPTTVSNEEFDGLVGVEDNNGDDKGNDKHDDKANPALAKIVPTALNDDNWEELLLNCKSDLPIVVEFHTPWCPGCKAQAPIFKQATARYAARARFFTADCDDFDHLARVGDVRKIPTTFFVEPSTKTQIVRVGLVRIDEVGEILTALAAKSAIAAQTGKPAPLSEGEDEHPYLLG